MATLDTEYYKVAESTYSNSKERFKFAFDWTETVDIQLARIESKSLHALLKKWYRYQDAVGGGRKPLDLIGNAISDACLHLNNQGWSGPQFSDDFVLYTECCADELASCGLERSATKEWLSDKESVLGSTIQEALNYSSFDPFEMGMDETDFSV